MKKFFPVLLMLPLFSFSQGIGTLREQLKSAPKEIELYLELSRAYRNTNVDSAFYFGSKAYSIALASGDRYNEGMALATQAANFKYRPDQFDSTIIYFQKALSVFREIGENEKEARVLNNLGIEYDYAGSYSVALGYYLDALKLYQKIDFTQGVGEALNNVALMYHLMEDVENAKKYYEQSRDIAIDLGDSLGWAMSLSNIASLEITTGDTAAAEQLYRESIAIRLAINNKSVAKVYSNLGVIYHSTGRTKEAMNMVLKAKEYNERFGEYRSLVSNYNNLGYMYFDDGQLDKSLEYHLKAIEICEERGYLPALLDNYAALVEIYKADGRYEQSLEAAIKFNELNDSLHTAQKQKDFLELREAYESEQKELKIQQQELEIGRKEAETQLEKAKSQRKNGLIFMSLGILTIVVIFSILLINKIRLVSKQKREIEQQKNTVETQKMIVEEKNREITDSIAYAKRIQAAILPPTKLVKSNFEDSFVLFKPKDIVAGDFYWMHTLDDAVLFAVADCTGHGVPGAMVSVVCHNALNRAVREYQVVQPAKILNVVRDIVIEAFEKGEEEIRDGMDIALCKLYTNERRLEFAGANNSLYYCNGNQLHEVKADKQPIGKYTNSAPFTNQSMELENGNSIYIFSDGFADQFGGPKGKKFKYKPFKELILANATKPMSVQKQLINETFESWKGDIEQVDDVCVIGVRI